MEKFLTNIVIGLIVYLTRAWVLMLALGGIHSHYTEVPNIGFSVSLMTVVAAGVLVNWDIDKEETK